ncbi:hypothetical protein [Brevundimonas sp.]|uniref:hypothetical protein n=1 Tax=Brevundimonas sp. TaxID=1871086 RepID=UPI0035178C3C
MTDQEFLEMEPRPAIDYWLAAKTAKERERLHHLYLVKRKVNLSDMVLRDPEHQSRADAAGETSAPTPRPKEVGLQDFGWLLMVGGLVGAFIAGFRDFPILWLLALSSAAMSAGFFCALFGWIGGKLDVIADRLDR